jgi:hypothetical protein
MIFIPGPVITLLTFPGVVMHEIAHRFMCDVLLIRVYNINYFSMGDKQAGYVEHEKTESIMHDFLIGFAPLFVNSFFCMIFTLPYSSTVHIAGDAISNPAITFLYWIGLSMGIHAFPSDQDVANISLLAKNSNLLFIVQPLCSIIWLLNRLRFFWINFIYAFILSFILPYFIFGHGVNP